VRLGREPGHVTDVAEDAGGADRADPVEVGQAAACGLHRGAQLLVAVFELPVEPDDVGEQFGREPPAGAPGDIPRADSRQQCLRLQGPRGTGARRRE
jgi:hypothetical protein